MAMSDSAFAAKIRTLSWSRGATINTGNYNNVRIECAAMIELGDDEDLEQEFKNMKAWVDGKVREEIDRLKGK